MKHQLLPTKLIFLLYLIIFVFSINIINSFDLSLLEINISLDEAESIGRRIRFNETGNRDEFLIKWNEGEEFLSLGIGHFIWYPTTSSPKVFQESFIYFLDYLKDKNYKLPEILKNNPPAFWNSKREFEETNKSLLKKELKDFIISTIPEQINFLIHRLNNSIPGIIDFIEEEELKSQVYNNYLKVVSVKNGYYPLIDYINFKGEGTNELEKYNNEGWGLLQVLLNMQAAEDSLKSFAHSALNVLENRIKNSPSNRNESRWRAGWQRRVLTYYPEVNLNPEINWTTPVIFEKTILLDKISYKYYPLQSPRLDLAKVKIIINNLPDNMEGKEYTLVGGGVSTGFHGLNSTKFFGTGYHFAGGGGNPPRDEGYKKDFTRKVINNRLEYVFYYKPTDIISNWDPEIKRYVKDTEVTLTLHPRGEWNSLLKSTINPYNWCIAGVGAGNKVIITIDYN